MLIIGTVNCNGRIRKINSKLLKAWIYRIKQPKNYISKFLQKGLIHRDKQDFHIKTPSKDNKDLGDC
jgi:hypothetical protein